MGEGRDGRPAAGLSEWWRRFFISIKVLAQGETIHRSASPVENRHGGERSGAGASAGICRCHRAGRIVTSAREPASLAGASIDAVAPRTQTPAGQASRMHGGNPVWPTTMTSSSWAPESRGPVPRTSSRRRESTGSSSSIGGVSHRAARAGARRSCVRSTRSRSWPGSPAKRCGCSTTSRTKWAATADSTPPGSPSCSRPTGWTLPGRRWRCTGSWASIRSSCPRTSGSSGSRGPISRESARSSSKGAAATRTPCRPPRRSSTRSSAPGASSGPALRSVH